MNPKLLLCFLIASMAAARAGSTDSFDVAVLDKLLARVAEDEETMRVGDMWFRVKVMRAWRDHLTKSADGRTPRAAFDAGVNTWTGGIVPYSFAADVTDLHKQAFVDAAREWMAFANLQFVPRTVQADFILVRNRAEPGGDSAVGRIGGAQNMNIGTWNRGTLCHEIGHALGLIHEHQRSDRDTYVTILTANIAPGMEPNFIKVPGSQNKGAYDFHSTMHYARNALSVDPDNFNTVEPKGPYAAFLNVMGQNNHDRALSKSDRDGMASVYGAPLTAPSSIVTNTRDSGPGSLRTAIYYGIDHPGTTVTFNIPTTDSGFAGGVFTISPTDQMTRLGAGTVIGGLSQPGNTNPSGPEIALDGALSEFYAHGLVLKESNCVVLGLIIKNWQGHGVSINGGSNNAVRGCYLGTNPSGMAAAPNSQAGVAIEQGAAGNFVGGTTAVERNVISGNIWQGVVILNAATTNNSVSGNYIGLTATGVSALPNQISGVAIFDGASGNRIGGITAGARNVISGNVNQGITLSEGAARNFIFGNYIGLNAAGTAAVPNGWSGVDLFADAFDNVIGGDAPAAANVISGNMFQGIVMSGAQTRGNLIRANIIGLNPAGDAAIPNGWAGVEFYGGAHDNMAGGDAAAQGNVIAGNSGQGIVLSAPGTTRNRIVSNSIGINAAGTVIKNGWSGVQIVDKAEGNFIGPGNVISGNGNYGILVNEDADGNEITGNLIGLKADGKVAAGNTWAGIALFTGASGNRIGGVLPAQRNVIAGNTLQGIVMGDNGTDANVVRNNFIGLDATGLTVRANGWSGVEMFGGASSNIIGGAGPGMRNYISGNGNYGVAISGGTQSNEVLGNSIGQNLQGGAAGNAWSGVSIAGGAQANKIRLNRIMNNLLRGVEVGDADTAGNEISQNSFAANGGLAIDLFGGITDGFGITLNDAGDGDAGPNGLQNRPVITSTSLGSTTTVLGTLASTANTAYRIEFFSSPAADPSGSGEGLYYLGALTGVMTNASGNASFTANLAPIVPAGHRITATATDPGGSTSEFSTAVTIAISDTDGDGIPNSVESANGLSVSVNDSALDADGDGFTNLDEYYAGTGIRDSASRPAIAFGGGAQEIRLGTVAGKQYRVESSPSLAPGSWSLLVENIAGTGSEILVTDPVSSTARLFYRALTVP